MSQNVQASEPLFPHIGVLAFPPESWGGLWMPRHHMLTRLSRYFTVLWMDPPKGWREILKAEPDHQMTEPLPNYPGFMCQRQSAWLPYLYRPASLGFFLARLRFDQAIRRLRERGAKKTVLYLWRPQFEDALEHIPHDFSCYHIDDEYSFQTEEQPLDEQELRVIRKVSHVFIHSPALLERKGHFNPRTSFVPNGVDYPAFSKRSPEPIDLREIPHPRIGYVGWIKSQLNLGLLSQLAARHSDWSLVLVGPSRVTGDDAAIFEQMLLRPNVYYLGYKSIEQVAAYPQHLDVCLLPYQNNAYTNCIYPMKLHEYLAGGRPVVGTPIRSLDEFQGVVQLAGTLDEWSAAIATGLSARSMTQSRVRLRRSVAATHDWNVLADGVAQVIAHGVGLNKLALHYQADELFAS